MTETAPSQRPPRRRKRRGKAFNLAMGILFLVLGIVGIVLPIIPQIPFLIMSLFFFSLVFPSVRRWMNRFLRRHPKIAHAYKKWRGKARRKRQQLIRKEKEWFGGR